MKELTRKEIIVAGLFSKGYSHKEVADIMNRSELTVKSHIQNIYNKLGIKRNLTALMMWFNSSVYKELNLS